MRNSALCAAALTLIASAVAAQTSGSSTPTGDSTKLSRLFVKRDLIVLGAFTGATIAMFPVDEHLATQVRREDLVTNKDLRRAASTFRFFGGPGPLIIGGAMYAAGRYAHVPRVAHLAVHGTEAVLVGAATSFALKMVLGRARPYVTSDTNPRSFKLGRGFRSTSFQSFPSGHSTAAFSVAAAVTAETAEWWPRSTWLIGTVLYGGATLVGLSRMYEDKHWGSDVVMGAAVGVFSGLKTVRFNHTHAGNRVDRWLLGDQSANAHLRLTSDGRGVGIAASMTW